MALAELSWTALREFSIVGQSSRKFALLAVLSAFHCTLQFWLAALLLPVVVFISDLYLFHLYCDGHATYYQREEVK